MGWAHSCWAAAITRAVLLQSLHQQGEQEWFLPAPWENPLGCKNSFPGLKRINCLESFCINKVDLLNTGQLLGTVTTVLQSAWCLVSALVSGFSSPHTHDYYNKMKIGKQKPGFWEDNVQKHLCAVSALLMEAKAWTLWSWGWGKFNRAEPKTFTMKRWSSLLWQLFCFYLFLYFSSAKDVESYFKNVFLVIVKKPLGESLFILINF